jgi:peroxiredoxin (alkyl hydroperoxide reductase subunit C)
MIPTLVTQKAPDFSAAAVLSNGQIVPKYSLSENLKNKYGVIFFYPLGFTFVCPSELIALNNRIDEFKKRNVEIIGISIDSQFVHHAWRNTPVEKGGIGPLDYTLVADIDHSICRAYGVEHPLANVALRGTFIIDKKGIIRSAIINDLPLGRNIDEFIRLIDAIEHHEQYGEVCPAGWNKGDTAIKATTEGIAAYLAEKAETL